MGNCASNTREAEEKARSDMIDRQIEEDSKKYKRECKILLLGAYFLPQVGGGGGFPSIRNPRVAQKEVYTEPFVLAQVQANLESQQSSSR